MTNWAERTKETSSQMFHPLINKRRQAFEKKELHENRFFTNT